MLSIYIPSEKLHKILLKHAWYFAKFPFCMPATFFLLFLSTATPILIIVPDNSALEEYIQQNKSVIADQPHLESKFMTTSSYISLILSDVTLSLIPLHKSDSSKYFVDKISHYLERILLLRK